MSARSVAPALAVGRRPGLRWPAFLRTAEGLFGLVVFVSIVVIAVAGPLMAPHALDEPIGAPGAGPSSAAPLGTDFLGRDVLSRLLHGGWSILWLALVCTALTYLIGVSVGLLAGYVRGLLDPLLMRSVDVLLTFPALLLLLVLIAGAGGSTLVLIIGIVLVLFPGVARIVRTATLETSTTSYVEAALARGERVRAILAREVLPNIVPYILADLGIRFSGAAILAANVNFLGLGLKAPAANWALMVAENRQVLATNIWSMVAPVVALALLIGSVNLMSDAYTRTLGRSGDRE